MQLRTPRQQHGKWACDVCCRPIRGALAACKRARLATAGDGGRDSDRLWQQPGNEETGNLHACQDLASGLAASKGTHPLREQLLCLEYAFDGLALNQRLEAGHLANLHLEVAVQSALGC